MGLSKEPAYSYCLEVPASCTSGVGVWFGDSWVGVYANESKVAWEQRWLEREKLWCYLISGFCIFFLDLCICFDVKRDVTAAVLWATDCEWTGWMSVTVAFLLHLQHLDSLFLPRGWNPGSYTPTSSFAFALLGWTFPPSFLKKANGGGHCLQNILIFNATF